MGNAKVRFDEIDGLRGLAIAQMVIYHLCYLASFNYFYFFSTNWD
jgi:uncharacterized membrane protein